MFLPEGHVRTGDSQERIPRDDGGRNCNDASTQNAKTADIHQKLGRNEEVSSSRTLEIKWPYQHLDLGV